MVCFRKVPKYRNQMTRFQVPNTDTVGTKKVPNPCSAYYTTVKAPAFPTYMPAVPDRLRLGTDWDDRFVNI